MEISSELQDTMQKLEKEKDTVRQKNIAIEKLEALLLEEKEVSLQHQKDNEGHCRILKNKDQMIDDQ